MTRARGAWIASLLVLLGAFAVHLLLLSQYARDPFAATLVGDALSYDAWASRIAKDGLAREPVFHQSPLFPLGLSVVYRISGASDPAAVRLVQALLSSLAIAMLVPLGRLYLGSDAAGVVAAVLALLHAPVAFHSLKLIPVTLALATQAAMLLALALARSLSSPACAAAAGATLGLAALARTEVLLFAPLALAAVMLHPGEPVRWPRGALFALALVLAVAPATLHNFRQGDLVLVASAGGENLFVGNQRSAGGAHAALHPQAGDIFSQRALATLVAEQASGRKLRPSEVSAYWRRRATREILADPLGWFGLELRKLGRILDLGDPTDLYSHALERELYLPLLRGLRVPPGLVLALGLAGLALGWRRHARTAWPLGAFCGVQLVTLLVFFVSTRLRLPMLFCLTPFSAHALVEASRRLREPRRTWLVAGPGLALVTLWAVSDRVSSRFPPREVVRLASVLSQQDRLDEALRVLEPVMSGASADGLALDQAGWILQRQSRFREAADRYRQALAAGLPSGRVHQTRTRLAVVLEREGQPELAAAEHDAAIATAKADAGSYYERGLFRLRRGDRRGAREDLEQAVRLDPAWASPREALRTLEH